MRVSVLFVALLAAFEILDETKAQTFVYGQSLRGDLIKIVQPKSGTKGNVWFSIDAVEPATYCPEDSAFVCFTSHYYALAIPKDFELSKKSWVHDGVTYEVIRTEVNVSIFGRAMTDLVLIKVPSSATPGMRSTGEEGHFFYSREHGVVGFGFWTKDDLAERSYWLEGERGFGAMPELH